MLLKRRQTVLEIGFPLKTARQEIYFTIFKLTTVQNMKIMTNFVEDALSRTDQSWYFWMSMSLAQRVLLTWIFILIFLIMLVLKLDEKIHWNWFFVFLPMLLFDAILLLLLIIKMAGRCKPGFDPRNAAEDLKKRVWYLVAILLKLAFCLTLCAKLEDLTDIRVSFICIPLWALLLGAMVELGYNVFHF